MTAHRVTDEIVVLVAYDVRRVCEHIGYTERRAHEEPIYSGLARRRRILAAIKLDDRFGRADNVEQKTLARLDERRFGERILFASQSYVFFDVAFVDHFFGKYAFFTQQFSMK